MRGCRLCTVQHCEGEPFTHCRETLTSDLSTKGARVQAFGQRAGDALGTGEVLILILASISPIMLPAGTSKFPLATLALILLLGAIVRRCRQLRSRHSGVAFMSAGREV